MQYLHHVYDDFFVTEDDDVAVVRKAPDGLTKLRSWSTKRSWKRGKFEYPRLQVTDEPFSGAVVAGLLQHVPGDAPQLHEGAAAEPDASHFLMA